MQITPENAGEDCRQEFEEWHSVKYGTPSNYLYRVGGGYKDEAIQERWSTWQFSFLQVNKYREALREDLPLLEHLAWGSGCVAESAKQQITRIKTMLGYL